MRAIHKGTEPKSLSQHRATAHSDYDNYEHKEELREKLVAEQFGLCCYCMSRIRADADSMKIEHWRCQHAHPTRQLEYGNLLGACLGGEGQPRRLQHCDTRKGGVDLLWNPANTAHMIESRIRYEPYGRIRSDDEAFDRELEETLNLNLPVLKNNRFGILASILDWWKGEKALRKGPVPRRALEKKLSELCSAEELEPFSGVAVWWLRQRLLRAS